MNECVHLVKIHGITKEIIEICLNWSAYGVGGGGGWEMLLPPPQSKSDGAAFFGKKKPQVI